MLTEKQIKTWVKALRSGKYKQTTGQLQNREGYCCLGVACEVLQQTNVKDLDGFLEGLVPNTQNFYQLEFLITNFIVKSKVCLTYLNDTKKLTFDEIADCIELVYIHKALD